MGGAMDMISWYIATLHSLLGHDKAAIVLGVESGDSAACVLCIWEHDPTPERRQAVQAAMATHSPDPDRPYLPGVNQCPNCNVGGCQGCDGNGR